MGIVKEKKNKKRKEEEKELEKRHEAMMTNGTQKFSCCERVRDE